jgi:hypothetical protein
VVVVGVGVVVVVAVVSGNPHPKEAQLARGERRYRRKVASPKQWQAIRAEKIDGERCRVCDCHASIAGAMQAHHLVARAKGGDDVADNLVPLCAICHASVTSLSAPYCRILVASLTDAEFAYCIGKGGEGFFERAYKPARSPVEEGDR